MGQYIGVDKFQSVETILKTSTGEVPAGYKF
jgi:hypothetical protein